MLTSFGLRPAVWPFLFALLFARVSASNNNVPFGLQTGYNSDSKLSSYAAGMVFNSRNREMTITGGTYGQYFHPGVAMNDTRNASTSNCFVAILRLPHNASGGNGYNNDTISWVRRRQYGSPSLSDFCSGIQVGPAGNILAFGHFYFSGVEGKSSQPKNVDGFVLDLDSAMELKGKFFLDSYRFQYPVAMTSDYEFLNHFVATIYTDDPINGPLEAPKVNASLIGGMDETTTGFKRPLYGNNFSVQIQRIYNTNTISDPSQKSGDILNSNVSITLQPRWTRKFQSVNGTDVQVSSLLYINPTTLLMVGYTSGFGPAFGYPGISNNGTELDGFVTKIHPVSGSVLNVTRVDSSRHGSNERIMGLCRQNDSSTEVYIVGTTDSNLENYYTVADVPGSWMNCNHAFLIKMDSETLDIIWVRQMGGRYTIPIPNTEPEVLGMACAVTRDGRDVYMGGTVRNGASLSIMTDQAYKSAGKDDIFVARLRTEDGHLEFARQIGTSEDDYLARGSSLATDEEGNLIVLGNTRGSFFREKTNTGIADIITFSVGRQKGEIVPLFSREQVVSVATSPPGIPTSENSGDFRQNSSASTTAFPNRTHVGGMQPADGTLQWDHAAEILTSPYVVIGAAITLIGLAIIFLRRKRQSKNGISHNGEVDSRTNLEGWNTTRKDQHQIEQFTFHRKKANSGTSSFRTLHTVEDDSSIRSSRSTVLQESEGNDFERLDAWSYVMPSMDPLHSPGSETSLSKRDSNRSTYLRAPREDDPYAEIYDLLALASDRLMGSEPSSNNKSRRLKEEDSLDIWGPEIM